MVSARAPADSTVSVRPSWVCVQKHTRQRCVFFHRSALKAQLDKHLYVLAHTRDLKRWFWLQAGEVFLRSDLTNQVCGKNTPFWRRSHHERKKVMFLLSMRGFNRPQTCLFGCFLFFFVKLYIQSCEGLHYLRSVTMETITIGMWSLQRLPQQRSSPRNTATTFSDVPIPLEILETLAKITGDYCTL